MCSFNWKAGGYRLTRTYSLVLQIAIYLESKINRAIRAWYFSIKIIHVHRYKTRLKFEIRKIISDLDFQSKRAVFNLSDVFVLWIHVLALFNQNYGYNAWGHPYPLFKVSAWPEAYRYKALSEVKWLFHFQALQRSKCELQIAPCGVLRLIQTLR